MGQDRRGSQKNAMQSHCVIDIRRLTSDVFHSILIFLLVNRQADLKQHLDGEEPQHCTSCLASPTSSDGQDVAIFSNNIFFLLSQANFEVWDFGEKLDKCLGTLEIYESLDE